MTKDTRTIDIETPFGNTKQFTKYEFTKRWIDHTKQLALIDWDEAWQHKVRDITLLVTKRCHLEFDRIYEAQNKRGAEDE